MIFSWLKWFFSGHLLPPSSGWRYIDTSNSWTSEIVIDPVKQSGLSGAGGQGVPSKSAGVSERGVSRGTRGPRCSLSPAFYFPSPGRPPWYQQHPHISYFYLLFPSVKRSRHYDTRCLWEALGDNAEVSFHLQEGQRQAETKAREAWGRQTDRQGPLVTWGGSSELEEQTDVWSQDFQSSVSMSL